MRVFPDDAGFCPADGSALQHASMVPIANTEEDPRLGSRLCNRYELRRVVADGGMGRVYEGIDKQTQTRVAVKVLHDEVSKDEVSLERFKREYEISSQLPHDYIVKVMDFQRDESSGVWLLVMEFLDGEELRFILKREKSVEPSRLVRMLAQTAIGLDEAHGRQFVHRDLKPDNLFLCGTREGDNVKILDFGSVKDKNKDAKKLTVLGTTIGSPFYMAPEQAQGLETLDARADVFALAAITYECITGMVPFTGNNGPSILLAILTKDPEPVSKKSASAKYPIPQSLDDVLEEALAKNPNIRTKTVGDFATQVGHAYGLEGDHKGWARIPIADLSREIAAAAARAPAPVARRIEAAADPFAAPDPFAAKPTSGTAPLGPPMNAPVAGQPPVYAYQQQGQGMPHAQQAQQGQQHQGMRSQEHVDMNDVAGMPAGRPPWLIAVVVGVAALVVGGGIAFVALSR
ncbi:MAG: Serine/threonine-protein kinase PknB [Myxococcaceae bacterium]|nr:Serine/threonine-protein kinase PknB [Myxococcaceae bacterium]